MLLNPHDAETTGMYVEDKLDAWHQPPAWRDRPAAAMPDVVRLLTRLAEAINASSFALLSLAGQGKERRLVPVVDSTFPGVSALSRVLSAKSQEHLALLAAEGAAPLWWSAEEPPFLLGDAALWSTEVDEPATDAPAIAFPVGIERGRPGLVVFSGEAMTVDLAALCETHARCCTLFDDVVRLRAPDRARAPTVSKREIECLRLTADGLTSDDIASTLGLSVHTANQYLTNSTHKLNAVNRIHAVAKALRSGLID